MTVAKSRPRPIGEYITKDSFHNPSKRDWTCLRHNIDIKGRSELEKHQEKECVMFGDLEDD